MGKKRVIFIITGLIVLTVISLLAFVFMSGNTFTRQPDTTINFSRAVRDNVGGDVRVVDIAMLGAHNSFTDRITTRSNVCPHDTNPLVHPVVLRIAPGTLSRFTQSQKSDATGLLMRGVRYFDVRLTYVDGGWYTHHSFISAPLSEYLIQIITFLTENPGEIIVFDIQHVRLGSSSFDNLLAYIAEVTVGGLSLFDFVTFDPYNTPLGELTKGQATQYGAAVVILVRTPTTPGSFHYEYNASMRSVWHNQIRTNESIAAIGREYNTLNDNPGLARDMFRVNQAQTTPNFSGMGNIFYTLFSWSILSHNADHNAALLRHEDFSNWLSVLPIFMVDFSDSPKGDFNISVMEKINEFNRNLTE